MQCRVNALVITNTPDNLVFDSQQRLTSLLAAMLVYL